jgi:hypothetical protein
MIDSGDYKAIAFYLSCVCKDRGYTLPKGAVLTADVSNQVVIGSVIVQRCRRASSCLGRLAR